MKVQTKSGYTFSNPIGLGPGFDTQGDAIDGLFDLGFGFIELGSVTTEYQHSQKAFTKTIDINLQEGTVKYLNPRINPSIQLAVSSLLERQTKIRDGKLKPKLDQFIGINIQANYDTMHSVPYLTHQDFVKNIKEITDFCDYCTVNFNYDYTSSGIKQYYQNLKSQEKVLSQVMQARNYELGKLAAYEFERIESSADYSEAVGRFYQRNSIVSTLKPMLIFIQLRFDDKNSEDINKKIMQGFVLNSLKYGVDGIVISEKNHEKQKNLLKLLRTYDKDRNILVISQGGIRSGQDAYERMQSGADLVQIYTPLCIKGPKAPMEIMHEMQTIMKSKGINDVNQIFTYQ